MTDLPKTALFTVFLLLAGYTYPGTAHEPIKDDRDFANTIDDYRELTAKDFRSFPPDIKSYLRLIGPESNPEIIPSDSFAKKTKGGYLIVVNHDPGYRDGSFAIIAGRQILLQKEVSSKSGWHWKRLVLPQTWKKVSYTSDHFAHLSWDHELNLLRVTDCSDVPGDYGYLCSRAFYRIAYGQATLKRLDGLCTKDLRMFNTIWKGDRPFIDSTKPDQCK